MSADIKASDNPTYVFPVAKAPSGPMPGKGFFRDLLSTKICGSKQFSMHANILTAGVNTGDLSHKGEMGWYVLSGRGWITMEGVRQAIGPGDAIFAPAGDGKHCFEVAPEQDLSYILIITPPAR